MELVPVPTGIVLYQPYQVCTVVLSYLPLDSSFDWDLTMFVFHYFWGIFHGRLRSSFFFSGFVVLFYCF